MVFSLEIKQCENCLNFLRIKNFVDECKTCKLCMTNSQWWEFLASDLMRQLKPFSVAEKIEILKLFMKGKNNGQEDTQNTERRKKSEQRA